MTEQAQKQPKEFDPEKNGRAHKTAPKTSETALAKPEPTPGAPGQAASQDRKQDEDPVGKVYDSVLIRRLGHYLSPTGGRRPFPRSPSRSSLWPT